MRTVSILGLIVIIIALPLYFRRETPCGNWTSDDPVLEIVTPHNEAIRFEFEQAFTRWYEEKYHRPVKINWRTIGGATEITRYLQAEMTSSMRRWWLDQNKPWPAGATDLVTEARLRPGTKPEIAEIFNAVRKVDDPRQFTSRIDLYFGGGMFDHTSAFARGLTVAPWEKGKEPVGLFKEADGTPLIPEKISGELWRTPQAIGCAISSFGIVANFDRLKDLGAPMPKSWDDLANPKFIRQVGLADPTKSGSIAKAFEMIIHQKIDQSIDRAGYSSEDVDQFEELIEQHIARVGRDKYKPGELPADVPRKYQDAIEQGWLDGLRLIQRISANARYFTDSAPKVSIDVSMGDAAVGMTIDFYGRYQAQNSRKPDGSDVMTYITPLGGTSVSSDPISLLRGSPHRDLAVKFIEFVLSEEGQNLWCAKPGTPGGNQKYALRRLPIRRDFYQVLKTSETEKFKVHLKNAADDLTDPNVNPYAIALHFEYRPRWVAAHFGIHRDIIRAMCIDGFDELQKAWDAIQKAGGAEKVPQAMRKLQEMPALPGLDAKSSSIELNWHNMLMMPKAYKPMDYIRIWTTAFRDNYRAAAQLAREGK